MQTASSPGGRRFAFLSMGDLCRPLLSRCSSPGEGTPVEPDSLTIPPDILRVFDLAGCSIEPFDRGLTNQTWLVGASMPMVLRRHSPFATRASIEWEHHLLHHLAAKGWPVPLASPASGGREIVEHEDSLWSIAPFLRGVPGMVDSPSRYLIQGRLLARLHHDMENFPLLEQRPGLGKTWELDAWVAPANAGSFNGLVSAFASHYPEIAALIRRQRYRSLRELARLHYPNLPELPIHGDFQRFNLLWQDATVTGVLDFDQARRDARVCDLAIVLIPFMPLDLQLARAFLEGYESVRPLTDTEWALIPALVRASLLRWVAHCLARWRTANQPAEPIIRTMTVRFPALEQVEPALAGLRLRPA